MKKNEVLKILQEHLTETQRQFGVKRLALFGSTVRDEAREDSDVDVLVEFEGKADTKRYFGLMFYLEDLLGCTLDLVTDKALRPELRLQIEKEMVFI